jgi:hypothetical protein
MKFLALIFSFSLYAQSIMLGTGYNNATQGRSVPELMLGVDFKETSLITHSVGVATDIYYHNAYQVSYFFNKEFGILFGVPLTIGVGPGMYYSMRFYDDGDDQDSSRDFFVGPALRISLDITEHFFVSLESLYGVGDLLVIFLAFQNTSVINIGVKF